VKLIKTAVAVVILSLAAYGTYVLLKKPPRLNISGDDIKYLEEIGACVQDGQASDSGLSGVLNNVEGAPPIGAVAEPAAKTSSAPHALLGIQAPESLTPPFGTETALPGEALDGSLDSVAAPLVASVPPIASFDSTGVEAEEAVEENAEPVLIPPVEEQAEPPAANLLNPFRREGVPVAEPKRQQTVPPPAEPENSSIPVEYWDGPASMVVIENGYSAGTAIPEPPPPPRLPPPVRFETSPGSYAFPPSVRIKPLPGIGQPGIRQLSGGEKSLPRTPQEDDADNCGRAVPIPVVSESAPVRQQTYQYPVTPARYDERAERTNIEFAAPKPEKQVNNAVVSFAPPRIMPSNGQQSGQRNSVPQHQEHKNINEEAESRQQVIADGVAAGKVKVIAESQQGSLSPVSKPEARASVTELIETQRTAAESGSNEKVRSVFVRLSRLLEQEQLNETEQNLIVPILDKLALEVIYAKNTHILEEPYSVKSGETIESIAAGYSLTPQLLRKINGLSGNQQPSGGTKLKVLAGQFDAVISSQRNEITLLLGGLYAGRVKAVVGNHLVDQRGEFYIVVKSEAKVLTLNNGAVIGGSVTDAVGSPGRTIQMSDTDAREVFDILSERSVIVFE
jgi:LysM repeat protein